MTKTSEVVVFTTIEDAESFGIPLPDPEYKLLPRKDTTIELARAPIKGQHGYNIYRLYKGQGSPQQQAHEEARKEEEKMVVGKLRAPDVTIKVQPPKTTLTLKGKFGEFTWQINASDFSARYTLDEDGKTNWTLEFTTHHPGLQLGEWGDQ